MPRKRGWGERGSWGERSSGTEQDTHTHTERERERRRRFALKKHSTFLLDGHVITFQRKYFVFQLKAKQIARTIMGDACDRGGKERVE